MRYEVDIQIDTKVTVHQVLSFVYPRESGTIIADNFPALITARMQYGDNIKALAVSLNTVGMVGINRIHTILSAMFGIPISTGTIFNMVKGCARNLGSTVEEIRRRVASLSLAHFDETGIRIDKKISGSTMHPIKIAPVWAWKKSGAEQVWMPVVYSFIFKG